MASFFGEIIEPTSRAIFDDFNDEETSSDVTSLHLEWVSNNKKLPSELDLTLLIHGSLSLAFAEVHFNLEKFFLAAEIHFENGEFIVDKDDKGLSKKVLPSRFYIDKCIGIFFVSPGLSSELGYQFTETISPILKVSHKIVVLTNESLYNFKTHCIQDLPFIFMKELKTSHGSKFLMAEKLLIPNFIIGIPAGVISWCEIFKKDASVFICYTDQQKLDSLTASPYISLLKKLNIGVIINENPDFNQKTYYEKPGIIAKSSNIYM